MTESRSMVVLGLGCGEGQEERIIRGNEETLVNDRYDYVHNFKCGDGFTGWSYVKT